MSGRSSLPKLYLLRTPTSKRPLFGVEVASDRAGPQTDGIVLSVPRRLQMRSARRERLRSVSPVGKRDQASSSTPLKIAIFAGSKYATRVTSIPKLLMPGFTRRLRQCNDDHAIPPPRASSEALEARPTKWGGARRVGRWDGWRRHGF
jgi:hypothetical protein